jgi:hypothetical protein
LSFRFELFWLASPLLADFVAKVENRTTPNLAKVDFQAALTLQSAVASIRRPVVVFLRNDVVPHVATCKSRQRL